MAENVKISVLMSVYNASPYLRDSVESVLGQTFGDFEFIIVDDASTDGSLKILRDYEKADRRIKVVSNEANIGMTRSLNRSFRMACGKYVARQDADDISLPDRFRIEYEYLENDPDIFLVGGGCIIISENGEAARVEKMITDEAVLKKRLEERNAVRHSSMMFRRRQADLYREKFYYAQDYDLLLNILSEGKRAVNLPDALIKYRVVTASISYSKRARQELFAKKAREFYFQRSQGGKDGYDGFEPDQILRASVDEITDSSVLRSEIKACFRTNSFSQVRKVYRQYLGSCKRFDSYAIYYLASFFPGHFIDFLRKTVWRISMSGKPGQKR